jgi:hypothetical protein
MGVKRLPAEGGRISFFILFAPAPRWILVLTPVLMTSPGIQNSSLRTPGKWANREEMRRNHWR